MPLEELVKELERKKKELEKLQAESLNLLPEWVQRTVFKSHWIKDLHDLVMADSEDLLAIPGIGQKKVDEIRRILSQL